MDSMHISVYVPDRIVLDESGVVSIVAESTHGFFGILPHRLDCLAILVPGILYLKQTDREERYLAIDDGILVKTRLDVTVSVRHAIIGRRLENMQEQVMQMIKQRSEYDQNVRQALARIEDDFIRLYREVSL